MFAILVTLFDAHRCVIIFIFPPEDSKLLWYLARTRRNWGPRETDADRRHIAIGRDETREVACQGIAPHLHDRPFVGIGRSLRIFQAPRRSFFPLFFPPRAPHFPSFTPPPLSSPEEPNLCFYLFDFETYWGFGLTRLQPLSLFSRSSSSLLSSSFAFLFLSEVAVSSFLYSASSLSSLTSFATKKRLHYCAFYDISDRLERVFLERERDLNRYQF